MKAHLRLLGGNGPAADYPVEGSLEIGRTDTGWNVVLRREGEEIPIGVQDALVSRRHASLYSEGGRLMIRDVGSVNGTRVNDHLLPQWVKRQGSDPLALKDGSVIKIGSTEIEVRIDTSPSYDELVKLIKDVRLESELTRRHPAEDAHRLANSFRIILDISERWCSTNTRVKELQAKLDILKEYLGNDTMTAEVSELQGRIGAELYEEEFLHDPQVWEVRDFCRRIVEHWSSRYMK